MRNRTQRATERGNLLAARTGFICSGAAFLACGLEVGVNHALLDSLLVSATAAIGLLALALGLLTSGWHSPSATINVVVTTATSDAPPTAEPPSASPAETPPADTPPAATPATSRKR
jgi:hypothetical protein